MADSELDNFSAPHEVLVREYLSCELDRQIGRAETRFQQFLAQPQHDQRGGRPIFRLPSGPGGWALSLAGAALAASLAAVWAGPSLRPAMTERPAAFTPGLTPVHNPVFIERDVQSQTFDDGQYVIDGNTPVRVFRRHDLQRTRWFDQDRKLQNEQLVPQDHVVYLPMKTY